MLLTCQLTPTDCHILFAALLLPAHLVCCHQLCRVVALAEVCLSTGPTELDGCGMTHTVNRTREGGTHRQPLSLSRCCSIRMQCKVKLYTIQQLQVVWGQALSISASKQVKNAAGVGARVVCDMIWILHKRTRPPITLPPPHLPGRRPWLPQAHCQSHQGTPEGKQQQQQQQQQQQGVHVDISSRSSKAYAMHCFLQRYAALLRCRRAYCSAFSNTAATHTNPAAAAAAAAVAAASLRSHTCLPSSQMCASHRPVRTWCVTPL
jgi:hypothetical protein